MADENRKYIRLLLVRIKGGDILQSLMRANDVVPVILPTDQTVGIGDFVFFKTGDAANQGEVVFESFTYEGDDVWRMCEILTGLVPFRATKYAHVYDCEWDAK